MIVWGGQEKKRWQGVGWYSRDPSNPHVLPFARTVVVEAATREEALDLCEKELDALYEKVGESVDFMNWYVKEL